MLGDVNRLFSMIKQSDLPYQVFADVAPVARPEPAIVAPTESLAEKILGPMMECVARVAAAPPSDLAPAPANEDVKTARKSLFSAYATPLAEKTVEEVMEESLSGVSLVDLFRRMASASAKPSYSSGPAA